MKIGVMSDSHGHLDTVRRVAASMINGHHVDTIIHLGDESTDVQELLTLPIEIIWVPGVFEQRYKDSSVPNRIIKEFEDVPFLLTHTPTKDSHDMAGDLDPLEVMEDGDVKVMLHGHSHHWRVQEEKGVIVINPGHLKPGDERGREPSYAILVVAPNKLEAKIIGLDDKVVAEKTFFFEA